MIPRRLGRPIVAVAALLWVSSAPLPASAQPTGGLSGLIYDQTGVPLPGVRVTIQGVTDRGTETGAEGQFAFPDLPEGTYDVSAERSGFERVRRAVRVQTGERAAVSLTLHVALVEEMIVTGGKGGDHDVQSMPIAISAVSEADFGRLGAQTIEEAPSLAPSVTFSQNTGWGQLTIRGVGTNAVFAGSDPEFGDLSRRRVPRSTSHGVCAVSRSRAHRSASRAAGHVVWTQRCRRGHEPHSPTAHQ